MRLQRFKAMGSGTVKNLCSRFAIPIPLGLKNPIDHGDLCFGRSLVAVCIRYVYVSIR